MLYCPQYKDKATLYSLSISKRWMNFVHKRCEPGRGLKPKWANNGLEFLLSVCEPQNISGINDEEFKVNNICSINYKKIVNTFILI